MNRQFRLAFVALLLLGACRPGRPPEGPPAPTVALPPVACRPDHSDSPPLDGGKTRLCVIDVGSRNVKLVVASVDDQDVRSLAEERTCRCRLQLGERTFDQMTQTARPLEGETEEALVTLVRQYVAQCDRDGGRVVGAVATEWARRAQNPDDIRKALQARAGVKLEILSRDREGRFGYLAATRGARGKLVLDFGSRSVQVSFWPRGDKDPQTVSLPLGIDEVGDRFFGRSEIKDYGAARAEYVAALRKELGPALEKIREAIRTKTLAPDLYSLAENGDVVLALDGKLWDPASHQGVDETTYQSLLRSQVPTPTADFGPVTAVLRANEIAKLGKQVEDRALFEELRSDRVKRFYGFKMLVYPALVAFLHDELGVDRVILVPQEMPTGLLVDGVR